MICKDLSSLRKELRSMSSQPDFHVKASHTPASEVERPTPEAYCSGRSPVLLARYEKPRADSPCSVWKMSGACLVCATQMDLLCSGRLSQNSIPWGMVTSDGGLWELTTPEHLTGGNGSLSWLSPRSSDHKGASSPDTVSDTLDRMGQPTNLPENVVAVENKMWPTPREFCYKDADEDRGKSNLGEVVGQGPGGSLNPDWVEWLMGLPIGWTDIECDEPMEHPGWDEDPAERWPTPNAHEGTDRAERTFDKGNFHTGSVGYQVAERPGSDRNIPRLTTRKEHRVPRLKLCGNGVVRQQAALASQLLLSG